MLQKERKKGKKKGKDIAKHTSHKLQKNGNET